MFGLSRKADFIYQAGQLMIQMQSDIRLGENISDDQDRWV